MQPSIHVNLVHHHPQLVHRATESTHPALCWDYLWCSLEVCPWRRGVAGPGEGGGGCGGWLGCEPPSGCCWCYLFSNTTGLNSPATLSDLPPKAAVPSRPMNSCRPEAADREKSWFIVTNVLTKTKRKTLQAHCFHGYLILGPEKVRHCLVLSYL